MPVISKKVYIAPSAFLAFVDRNDPRHQQASAFFRFLGSQEYMLFTDDTTISRSFTDIFQKISPSLAKDFLKTIFSSDINILYAEERDIKAAFKAYTNYQSVDLLFPDALISVLANKRGISQILTFEYLHPLFGQSVFYLPF
jgi:predicted nucleic acid-binding protein